MKKLLREKQVKPFAFFVFGFFAFYFCFAFFCFF